MNLLQSQHLWQRKLIELHRIIPNIDMKSFLEKFIKYQTSSPVSPIDLITRCISLAAAQESFPWECDFKPGDKVNYHFIAGGNVVSNDHEIKTIELEPNNYGCDVAWITNKPGCVDIKHLSII